MKHLLPTKCFLMELTEFMRNHGVWNWVVRNWVGMWAGRLSCCIKNLDSRPSPSFSSLSYSVFIRVGEPGHEATHSVCQAFFPMSSNHNHSRDCSSYLLSGQCYHVCFAWSSCALNSLRSQFTVWATTYSAMSWPKPSPWRVRRNEGREGKDTSSFTPAWIEN